MFYRLAPLLISALATAPLHAADAPQPPMEETLVFGTLSRFSALKSDTPIMESARSVSIITQQQIIDMGALTLDDTFTYSAGVYGETYGFATRGDWIKVRGLDVPQYQDSLQSLFGNYNNTRPHIYTLEQVEILKGPASVLFGAGSPGGIVNVISKRPREERMHEVQLEVGNNERVQVALDSTGAIAGNDDWLYRMVALYLDTDTQVDHVDEETLVLAPSITWRPGDDTDITVLLNYTDTEGDVAAQFLPVYGTLLPAPNGREIDSGAYLGDPDFNYYNTETKAVTLLASHRFNDVWSMEFTSRYTDGEADYQQAWPAFIGGDRYVYNDDGSLYGDGTVPRSWYGADSTSEQAAVDIRFRANFDTGPLEHAVLLGTQYQNVRLTEGGFYAFALGYDSTPGVQGPDNMTGDTYWINVFDPSYGIVPPSAELNALYAKAPDNKTEDIGIYASDEISLGNWRLTLGLRYDETEGEDKNVWDQEDDEISTSAGLLYQFDNGLAPYVSYAESFEPVIADNGRGEPLDPQEGEQVEVGIKYQPDNFPALVTLAWFDLEQSNLPDPQSLPGGYDQQSGVAKIDGIELEALAQLGDFTVELNVSHMDTEDPRGNRLASVPDTQASSWVTWRPAALDGFRAGAGVRYVGESWDGMDKLETPDYTLGDLMLGWEYRNWDFSFNVRNITDRSYYATCIARGDCFPGDERTLVGRVTYRIE
jgi:iron complex outermembrane receptor protein